MAQIIASTYEIIRQIGSGGGGIVYLGQHLRLGKPVVLKADKRRLSTDPEVLRREVDALKNLSHTYIPQVYDFVSDDEHVYTVMDYIEGDSFDKLLKRGAGFTQRQVIEWARQLLDALRYLHGRPPYGILHSDIKPANIMLTPAGDVCLIDFNIALALGEGGAVAVGRSRGYASPEHYGLDFSSGDTTRKSFSQNISAKSVSVILEAEIPADAAITEIPADAGKTELMTDAGDTEGLEEAAKTDVLTDPGASSPGASFKENTPSGSSTSGKRTVVLDVRSDIYSLGATLYHLLTGERPRTTAPEVKPLSPEAFSPRVVAIINKAMHPNPDLRYQSAEEMLYDLNHLHEDDPRAKRHKRRRLAACLSLAAIFLASGLTAFAGLKQMEQTQSAYALAEYAANALNDGDVLSATSLALEALPEKSGPFALPYIPQAQSVLADALGVYDLADGYKPFRTVELPSPPFKIVISEDGGTAAAVYAYEVAVFRTNTGEIVARLPAAASALADAEFIGATLVYAGETGVCAYDTTELQALWSGKPATEIAVSADGKTIAAVFKDEDTATIYTSDGAEKGTISFEGKGQRITVNDTFANPNDNLLALNRDGSLLAAGFADGSLAVFDTASGEKIAGLLDASEFFHFEGGFSGAYFAFSATGKSNSVFAVMDMQALAQTGGFQSEHRFGVLADESGIFVSADNLVVKLDPVSGEQQEMAYTDADVTGFARDTRHTIVATDDDSFAVFEREAGQITKSGNGASCDFVCIAGDFAVTGGRDAPVLRIIRREDHADAQIFVYDASYFHDEARVNEAGTRVLLFSYNGFRLHDSAGRLLFETEIPDAAMIYDQQYSRKSGNLAVLYRDALRIYSGEDGSPLFEETGLKSTFYAPYGVSVLDESGVLRLIDRDTAEVLLTREAEGDFAAFCGVTVDDAFLEGRELLGAAAIGDGFVFAVGDGKTGAVYDGDGKKLFDVAAEGKCEAFFTRDKAFISPEHGTPAAYDLDTGKKTSDLEKDAYLTYITQTDPYIVSEYVLADGARFGLLLDAASCKPVARLPQLTDIAGEELLFDYRKGSLRKGRIYSIDELINIAEGGDGT